MTLMGRWRSLDTRLLSTSFIGRLTLKYFFGFTSRTIVGNYTPAMISTHMDDFFFWCIFQTHHDLVRASDFKGIIVHYIIETQSMNVMLVDAITATLSIPRFF